MWALAVAAALVSGAFAAQVSRGWVERRRPNALAWCVALAMFAIASWAAGMGMLLGWTPRWFRLYYLLGAIVNVPVLALGTIYLLASRRAGHTSAAVVVVASVVAAVVVFSTDLLPEAAGAFATNGIPAGSEVMPTPVRMMSRSYSFAGFAVVIVGALLSALRLRSAPGPRPRALAIANVMIAAGTLIVAVGSGFAFYGKGWPFALGLLVGVSVMYAGFLRTRAPAPTRGESSTA